MFAGESLLGSFSMLSSTLNKAACLCEAGAEKNQGKVDDDSTPLHVASLPGHHGVVRVPCEAGAEKNQAMNDAHTALFIVSQQGHLEVVRFLCEAGAEKNTILYKLQYYPIC